MLDTTQIQYYKEMYYGHKLIYVRFSDQEFLFRTLGVKEYEIILNNYPNEYSQEDAICNLSCVYPEKYDFAQCEYAFLPSVIKGYIIAASDLDNNDEIFEEYNLYKTNTNLFQQCMDLIKTFIGDYTYEEMEDWTWQHLMQMTVRAENIAKYKGYDYHIKQSDDKPYELSIKNEKDIQVVLDHKLNPLIYFRKEIDKDLSKNNIITDNPMLIDVDWYLKGLKDNGSEEQNDR